MYQLQPVLVCSLFFSAVLYFMYNKLFGGNEVKTKQVIVLLYIYLTPRYYRTVTATLQKNATVLQ